MDNEPKKFVSTAIIYDPANKKVLLQHRDNRPDIVSPGKWGLFGGHGKPSEDPKVTLTRELKEETGISFGAKNVIPLYNYFVNVHKLRRYVFLIQAASNKLDIKLTEGQGFAWVPLDTALKYDLTERTAKDLKTFIKTKTLWKK